jgi:hypothetical protein
VLGYFKPIMQTHQWGTINPPICDQCVVEALGPKPLANPAGAYDNPCTIFGGADPNFANVTLAWQPCSRHGTWNGTACVCNTGWQLGNPLETFNSSIIIKTCDTCAVNWGPLVVANQGGPFCNRVYTPGTNGEAQECGGKGTYVNGQCNCFYTYTLIPYENVYTCG